MTPETEKKFWRRAKARNTDPSDRELDYMTSVVFRLAGEGFLLGLLIGGGLVGLVMLAKEIW